MSAKISESGSEVSDLVNQMSRGISVLNGWDAVLNIDEAVVNQIFQAQFEQSARDTWKDISFTYCHLYPNPLGSGKLAIYTGVDIGLAKPRLNFTGDNQAFCYVYFKATGKTGRAAKVVDDSFDPHADSDPSDPALNWEYRHFSEVDFTGRVPLSAIAGASASDGGRTEFVLDFPSGSFNCPPFDEVEDQNELHARLKDYLETHEMRYVVNSIRTDLRDQMPQMAPKSFRLAVLTTNEKRNIFQIFIATQNPACQNLTMGVNEPVPRGYGLSAFFNRDIVKQLDTSLMVQTWLFLGTNLVFPGHTDLSLGPQFAPDDSVVLGVIDVDTSSTILPDPPTPKKEQKMLNIQKTRQIAPQGQPAFTAYGDDADANAWYIPPKVVWAKDAASDLPLFSLVRYKGNGGAVNGFCRFSVQLMVDQTQQDALLAAIPGATVPQFDWIQSGAVFTYTVDGKATSVHATPTNFGSQTVTFSVPLPDEKAIAAFENAFSPEGSKGGTFGVSYELAANTRLPAVTVTTKFDSTLAYQYQVENKYATQTRYHTDTWGHRHTENVQVYVGTYVKEMIQQSQAATVEVVPGQGLTPTLLTEVETWAQTQLQQDVEQAVNKALSLIKNPTNDFSMNSVSSFTHTLNSSNVVPWYFDVEGTLPPFEGKVWEQVSSEVKQQQLDVLFDVQEDLEQLGVDRVNMTFVYGDTPPLTHTFKAGEQSPWNVRQPGRFQGSDFVSSYRYKYDVIYAQRDGNTPPPLSTDWITDDSTTVELGETQLGLLAVTFEASNIEWADETRNGTGGSPRVKEISVKWNWIADPGSPVLAETLVLKKDKHEVKTTLRSARPAFNQQYCYSLTFLMDDGSKLHANGLVDSAVRQRIDHPLADMSFSVFPMFPDDTKLVVLRATFDDDLNDIHLNKLWQAQPGSRDPSLATASFDAWNFKAVTANANMSTVVISGFWVDGGGGQHVIPEEILVGTNSMIAIGNTQKRVTATIDASNVTFVPPKTDGVYRVVALVASSVEADGAKETDPLANATTITFEADQPAIQYFTTPFIGIDQTPTFHYQYIYTENVNNAANTKVTNNWNTPQSTNSTALPVVPGTPQGQVALLQSVTPIIDARTRALHDRHDSFCRQTEVDWKVMVK